MKKKFVGRAKLIGDLKEVLFRYENELKLDRKYKIYITYAKNGEYRLKIK